MRGAERESPDDSVTEPGGLRRVLGPFDVTMFVMGSIVGAGVFNLPSGVAASVGSTWGVLLLWTFAELGGMLPHAGGQYVFVREAYGRFAAFLFGWVLLTAISSSALAFVAGVFADHTEDVVRDLTGFEYPAAYTRTAVPIALIAVVTTINASGVPLGRVVQDASMLAKIAGILGVIVLGALVGAGVLGATPPPIDPDTAQAKATVATAWTWKESGTALLSVAFAYGGWQNVAAIAGEIKRPARSLPLGILLGTVGVIALYLALNGALVAILGVEDLARRQKPVADAARAVLPFGGTLIAALVALSTFAFVQGLSMLAPRIYYAMARDGVFLRSAGWVHPKSKAPVVAIALQGAFAVLHVLLSGGHLKQLVDICILCDLVFFTSCGFALFWLRRKRPDAPRPYRALGYPWLPAVFCATAATAVVRGLFDAKGLATLYAGVLFAVGIGAYVLWRRADAPREA
jgi:APA family basic amino acid/polyamine antiporter